MPNRVIDILLVEDDPGDVELTRLSLNEAKLSLNMTVVGDGEEAMAYVRKAGKYAGAKTPNLILLDLNLPRKDGREVLTELKSDEHLKEIPVVVLTTSDAEEDIAKSYASGANCYVTKPIDLDQFDKVVHSIQEFWFTVVKLPPRKD